MLQKIWEYMVSQKMLQEGDHLCVALSGGADSVALLCSLRELRETHPEFTLSAVHVEHGIRGEESLEDASFVENLCTRLDIPLKTFHVNVPAFAKKQGLGTEEAARILRYQAFRQVAGQGCKIALAHHMEDQAETVLFQMVRGSGLSGMGGMAPVNEKDSVTYIRPMLSVTKGEILDFLKEIGQDYCTDSTNADIQYSRNYIRNLILPELSKVNSQAILHICQTAERMRETSEFIRSQALENLMDVSDTTEEYAKISCKRLLSYPGPIAQEMVRQMLFSVAGRQKDLTASHVEAVLHLAEGQSGKSINLPYEMTAERIFEQLVITKEKQDSFQEAEPSFEMKAFQVTARQLEQLKEDSKQEMHCAFSNGESMELRVFARKDCSSQIPKKAYTKWVSYDKIKNGFLVRNRQEKDFLVVDQEGHKKKLKEYFIGEKIPAALRENIPLIAQESEIAWVIGKRLSEAYKVTDQDAYVLEIKYNGGNESGSYY